MSALVRFLPAAFGVAVCALGGGWSLFRGDVLAAGLFTIVAFIIVRETRCAVR